MAVGWFYAISWDFFHPPHADYCPNLFEEVVRIANQLFAVEAVWLFVACGQLLVFYHQTIVEDLRRSSTRLLALTTTSSSKIYLEPDQRTTELISRKIFPILSVMKDLQEATHLLHSRFCTMLMANCLLSVVVILTSFYYGVEHLEDDLLMSCWEAFDFLESFLRLWIICGTADYIRQSVSY